VPTHLLGARGADPLGEYIDHQLSASGIKSHLKIDVSHPTGLCIVLTEANGERTMIPSAGANAQISSADYISQWPEKPFDHLHVSGYSLFHPATGNAVLECMERAIDRGCTISFDPSAHTLLESHSRRVSKALEMTHLLIANEQEAQALAVAFDIHNSADEMGLDNMMGGLISMLNSGNRSQSTVVVTLGSAGAAAANRDSTTQPILPSASQQIVSTTGAGDAFNAGFITSWMRSPKDLPAAINSGNDLASQIVGRVGASPLDIMW
jgi:sugar/nucleoside kinase (ribokinase family)